MELNEAQSQVSNPVIELIISMKYFNPYKLVEWDIQAVIHNHR